MTSPPTTCFRCGATVALASRESICPHCLAQETVSSPSPPTPRENKAPATIVISDTDSLDAGKKLNDRFGDYQLIEEISRGGMGVVYKARQISLNRVVAVKMILHARFNNAQFVRRFRVEAEAAGNLRHPNIVGIYEIGQEKDQHYFSMEYVEGRDLASMVRDQPLPARLAAQLVEKIARAIHYAHQHGILHRDLKPSNVLIDTEGEPRITDFGIAKRITSAEGGTHTGEIEFKSELGPPLETDLADLTASGQVLGTPNYMSPEQAAGRSRQVDARTDVYSLGAIFFTLLTGRPPFMADNFEAMLTQVLQVEVPSLRLLNPTVPRDLETIAIKCLQKDPARRYASAQELAEELERFLGGESIKARPVGALEKAWRWCKRKPVVAALGLSTILLLMAIAVGSPIAIYRIERSRQLAETNSHLAQAREVAVRETSYATEMLFASEEIDADNRGHAMELLDRSRPQPGQADFRGWEWRFLWAQCRSDELFTLGTHDQEIYRLAFLPDGRLVCGDFNEMIKIWDPKAKKVLAAEKVGPVSDLEISPEGSVIAAATWSPGIAFLDATNLSRKGSAMFTSKVYHLAFSPRDKVFATAGPDHVALWSFTLPSPSLLWTQEVREVTGLAFAPDGETFAFATRDQRVWIFDAAAGTMRRTMAARGDPAEVAFSPDGTRLAVAHWNGTVAIYDPTAGREITTLSNQSTWVSSLAFSRTDPILATSAADQKIRLWDTTTWQQTASFQGHLSLVDCVTISPNGQWLASGSKDRSVRIWDLKANTLPEVSRNFADVRRGYAVSPKAEFLAVVNGDSTLSIWDLSLQRETRRVPIDAGTSAIAVSPTGKAVVLAGPADKVRLHRFEAMNSDIPVEGVPANKAVATFSLDGERFAVGGRDQLLRAGTTGGSSPVKALKHPLDMTTEILFSPDGRRIFAAHESGRIRGSEIATGEMVMDFRPHEHVVAGIALDAGGHRLATASSDGTVGLWDVATRRKLGSYGKSSIGYMAVSISQDGRRIAASSGEGAVKVWDLASGREVARFKGADRVLNVRFGSDDRTLVMATSRQLSLFRAPTFAEIQAAETSAIQNRPLSKR